MSSQHKEDLVFKALAHRRRREILDKLKDNPLTTGSLCDCFEDMDRCTVMLHLKVLAEAQLIIIKRDGRERWNYLNALPIKRLSDRWISTYAHHAVAMLDQLDADVSEEP